MYEITYIWYVKSLQAGPALGIFQEYSGRLVNYGHNRACDRVQSLSQCTYVVSHHCIILNVLYVFKNNYCKMNGLSCHHIFRISPKKSRTVF